MARGADGKLRRKNERKNQKAEEAERLLADTVDDSDLPGPPSQEKDVPSADDAESEDAFAAPTVSTDNTDTDGAPIVKKKKVKKSKAKQAQQQQQQAVPSAKSKEGIQTLPLIFLIMLTGTTVLPALLYAGDWFGVYLQNNHIMGSLGHRLGIGPSPKKRVLSFYEKHDPSKLNDVPTILSKHYGDYPKLTKRLERKYQDYGYFLNWEQDEAPMTLAFDKLYDTRDLVQEQFNQHAPQFLKTGARNANHNVGMVYKQARKIWIKKIWPHVQPLIGVPDEKTARAQKRKDAAAARDGRKKDPNVKRKNKDFRDDEDEM
mmetsp:Transcript_26522/g.48107  ORF Transcript_26522/g.48107 Transcript_26522/m.48107 type:complete len:317 (-) Transcript_26522:312-1262(-)